MRVDLIVSFIKNRCRFTQRGFLVAELAAGMVLIMLPCAIIMFALPQYEGFGNFTVVASREIGRTEAFEGGSSDDEITNVINDYAKNYGVNYDTVTIRDDVSSLSGMPDPSTNEILVWIHSQTPGEIVRGESVQVEVKMKAPLFNIPGTAGLVSPVISSRHTEIVDPYASFREVCSDGHSVARGESC